MHLVKARKGSTSRVQRVTRVERLIPIRMKRRKSLFFWIEKSGMCNAAMMGTLR